MSGPVKTFDPQQEAARRARREERSRQRIQQRNRERLSLQEIWRLGCLGDPLSENDREHFVKMARNRFYTFQLGLQHEIFSRERSEEKIELLIRGLVTELFEGPGLTREWHDSEFCEGQFGERVSRELKRRHRKASLKRWFEMVGLRSSM